VHACKPGERHGHAVSEHPGQAFLQERFRTPERGAHSRDGGTRGDQRYAHVATAGTQSNCPLARFPAGVRLVGGVVDGRSVPQRFCLDATLAGDAGVCQ